jgi:hypothetical protein
MATQSSDSKFLTFLCIVFVCLATLAFELFPRRDAPVAAPSAPAAEAPQTK